MNDGLNATAVVILIFSTTHFALALQKCANHFSLDNLVHVLSEPTSFSSLCKMVKVYKTLINSHVKSPLSTKQLVQKCV